MCDTLHTIGDYGCTQALRHGHGLRVLQQQGSGKAISVSSSSLSATAGFFMSGEWQQQQYCETDTQRSHVCGLLLRAAVKEYQKHTCFSK